MCLTATSASRKSPVVWRTRSHLITEWHRPIGVQSKTRARKDYKASSIVFGSVEPVCLVDKRIACPNGNRRGLVVPPSNFSRVYGRAFPESRWPVQLGWISLSDDSFTIVILFSPENEFHKARKWHDKICGIGLRKWSLYDHRYRRWCRLFILTDSFSDNHSRILSFEFMLCHSLYLEPRPYGNNLMYI